ncbi:Hypothetical predicted protein [Mytilus galloprovincialis]|nr:Hypothetical predicted protein [Mytilus galloprovincialis]
MDSKTQPPPTAGSLMTDDHYQFVMQFIFQERQSRLQLEKYVKQLQQELVTTKADLTTEINGLKQCGCASNIKNKTSILQNEFNILKQDHDALKIKYENFQKELNRTNNRSIMLENEMSLLRQLKSVSDLKVIFDLQNKTKHLEQEIQATNSRQQAINSEASARKQDFLALYQKVQISETEIQSNNLSFGIQTKQMERRILEVNERYDNKTKQISRTLGTIESSMQNRITALSTKLNGQILNIQKGQNDTANRALFTASGSGTISKGSVIPFKKVHTSHGIKNLSSVNNSGIFTVEKEGYYLISCFVNTNTANAEFDIRHNSISIASATKHGDSGLETHAATITAHLNVGDIVKVTARNTMAVDSAPDSMLTVVQII